MGAWTHVKIVTGDTYGWFDHQPLPSLSTMAPSTLAVLPLPHPIILLPAARITLPFNLSLGERILSLVDQSDDQPVIAAVPFTNSNGPDSGPSILSQWGTAARIVRIVRPPPRNPRQPYLVSLQGLTRIHLKSPIVFNNDKNNKSRSVDSLVVRPVEYPDTNGVPSSESVAVFKGAALRLLDRLANDASQPSRKDGWLKVSAMVEDVSDSKAPSMADVMVAAVNGEYSDKLGTLIYHLT
jgi:ATP-dependent Lon protease